MHTHQPGEAVFRSIRPEDVDWKPFQRSRRRPDWLSSLASPLKPGLM